MKDIKDLIAPNFYKLHYDIQNHLHDTYRLGGGRGSLKTSTIVVEILTLMQKHSDLCTVVFMKQGNRIRQGAFAAFTEGISRAGLDAVYKYKLTPPRIINKETGQIIVFMGLDDPQRTKGLSTGSSKTFFGIVYFNEITDFISPREIDIAIDSVIRGGNISWCFQDYNPPRSAANWVNEDSKKDVPGRLVHFSDYRTVPKQWLGEAFLKKVRQTYLMNPLEYEWRYLGKVVGTEGLIFKNIIKWKHCNLLYDMIIQGMDLGWNDPKVFVRWGIDISHMSIYCLDELYMSETTNDFVADWILNNGYTDTVTILESAGGKEAQVTYNKFGIPTDIVVKGRDLKRNSLEYLLSRAHIFIDPDKTPNVYREFSQYSWKVDRNTGKPKVPEEPIAYDDHTVDATRYALQPYLSMLEAC